MIVFASIWCIVGGIFIFASISGDIWAEVVIRKRRREKRRMNKVLGVDT